MAAICLRHPMSEQSSTGDAGAVPRPEGRNRSRVPRPNRRAGSSPSSLHDDEARRGTLRRAVARRDPRSETGSMPERTTDLEPTTPVVAREPLPDPPHTSPSVDDVGEASFPASDPPAVWTWDPRPPVR